MDLVLLSVSASRQPNSTQRLSRPGFGPAADLPGYSQPVEVLAQDGVRFPGGGGIGHMTVDMTAGSGGFIAF